VAAGVQLPPPEFVLQVWNEPVAERRPVAVVVGVCTAVPETVGSWVPAEREPIVTVRTVFPADHVNVVL
jgi:hypothetical protein